MQLLVYAASSATHKRSASLSWQLKADDNDLQGQVETVPGSAIMDRNSLAARKSLS